MPRLHRGLAAVAVLALVQGCAGVLLPRAEPVAKAVNIPGAYETYPTGLRVVTYARPDARRLSVTVSYGAGSADDPPGLEGLAHLLEHLSFRSRPDGGPELKARLIALGVDFNAFTDPDGTHYLADLPVSALPGLLEIESERLRDPLSRLDEATFRTERDVVVAELRERYETSAIGAQLSWVAAHALGAHPYARLASPASVAAISLEDVRRFARERYRPENAIVVVTGAVERDPVRSALAQAFGPLIASGRGLPDRAPASRLPPSFALEAPPSARATRRASVERPRLWMTWTLPGRHSGTTVKASLLAEMLETALGTAFFQDEKVTETAVHLLEADAATLLVATLEVEREADLVRAEEKLRDQLYLVSGRADSTNLLAESKRLVELYEALELLPGHEIARWLRNTGSADYVGGAQRQLQEQTESRLDTYAAQFLNRERAATLLVLPEGSATTASVGGAVPAIAAEDFDDSHDALPPGAADPASLILGAELASAQRFELPGGVRVVALRRPAAPLVDVRLVLPRNPTALEAKVPSLPTLAAYGSWYSRPSRHAALIGAATLREQTEDFLLVGARAPSGNLPHVLFDLGTWAREHSTHTEIFLELQKFVARQVRRDRDRLEWRTSATLAERLYPGHRYGRSPRPEELAPLSTSDARAWVDAQTQPQSATLLIVGELPAPAVLEEQVRTFFGEWRTEGSPPVSEVEAPWPTRREVVLLDRPGAAQVALSIGARMPRVQDLEHASAEALVLLLEQRLDRGLREQHGVSYGAVAALSQRRGASALLLQTTVDAQVSGAALSAVLGELSRATGGITPEEAQRARWSVARSFDSRFASTREAALRFTGLALLDRPADYWDRFPGHLGRVDAGSMQAVARKISLGKEIVVAVGDARVVAPLLRSAGFEVEVLAAPSQSPR